MTHGHLIVVHTGGGGFRPWLAGMENLNHKCQIFPTEYKCYIFLTWGCLKVNNSLSQANDCEEKGKVSKALSMCRKSRPLDFVLRKIWAVHLNTIFDLMGGRVRNLDKPIFKSSNTQGLLRGGCWNFECYSQSIERNTDIMTKPPRISLDVAV